MTPCAVCSSSVPGGARFCPTCGAPVEAIPLAATVTRIESVPAGPVLRSRPGVSSGGRFLPGSMLGERYRIVGLIGRGGMGEVYRADDLKLGQVVALKLLPQGLEQDAARLERLLNEVRLALRVSHPNVCRAHDLGEAAGQHYLSMEYVDGEDLASLLRRIGRLPRNKAVEVARQLCAGLAAAHDQGILHRDLKPANVMLDGRGRVKITDFGLAGLSAAVDGAETRLGTPAYMAPEQLAGQSVTVQSDVYALGLVLYELFAGQPAFSGRTPQEISRARLETEPSSLSSHVEGIDPAVERAIARCLEPDPRRRPPSALAVAAALPGGDPVAAALAAGETPSPEMVAAAGGNESGLRAAVAVVCVLFFAAAVAVSLLAARRLPETVGVLGYAGAPEPPVVLEREAAKIVRGLGYDPTPPIPPGGSKPTMDTPAGSRTRIRRRSDGLAWHGRIPPRCTSGTARARAGWSPTSGRFQ